MEGARPRKIAEGPRLRGYGYFTWAGGRLLSGKAQAGPDAGQISVLVRQKSERVKYVVRAQARSFWSQTGLKAAIGDRALTVQRQSDVTPAFQPVERRLNTSLAKSSPRRSKLSY